VKPAKILVVDDTPRNVKFLVDLLGVKGYSVVTATSGAEALQRVAAEQPDLVLLDVVMPDISGYEVCRQIRANAGTAILPVVMVTALDPTEERIKGLDAGADDLIHDRLRMWRGHGDDGDIQPIAAHHPLQLFDVVDRYAAPRLVADLLVGRIEECRDLEPFLTKSGVIGQRKTEIAGAHDGHPQMTIETENLPQVPAQLLDVVADAADAELAKVRQILANLRGVEMELLGQGLRGDGLRAAGV